LHEKLLLPEKVFIKVWPEQLGLFLIFGSSLELKKLNILLKKKFKNYFQL